MKLVNVLGFPVSAEGLDMSIDEAWKLMRDGPGGHVMACANPHSLIVASGDAEFEAALKASDILVPDGAGIILAGRILRKRFSERVAGYEFFQAFCERANREGDVRFFFLGSNENVLARIRARMAADYPQIEVVGTFAPPYCPEFSDDDLSDMARAVKQARPDVLWVGMTAPKQEKWVHQHGRRLNVPFCASIGAVFDFYAGTIKRTPAWLRRIGLEWLPRLLREPKRLWRRNLVSSPLFLIRVFGQAIRPGSGR